MPRVSATSAPIRQGTTSLAAPEAARAGGSGADAPGCAVMIVSVVPKVAAGQNPLPVRPSTGMACRTRSPARAVPVPTSSTGASTADGSVESELSSKEPTCVPSGSTIQPALTVAPRTTAVARYRPDGLLTTGTEKL